MERDALGVLLVAHGTVTRLDDLPEFLRRIRRGRPASPELVAELRHRYERIGGSPLLAHTEAQASALGRALGVPVFVGMRLWDPSLAEALRHAQQAGVRRLVVLPLAPFSVPIYFDAAVKARAELEPELESLPELVSVPPWGTAPGFVRAYAERIRAALATTPDAELVLTAHSLPLAVIRAGDPYHEQVQATAAAVSAALGRGHHFAYQSQGADGGEWLGPPLDVVLAKLAGQGARSVVLAPIGFLSDHVETLYDLDVEAANQARELGLALQRVTALNDDPSFIAALADLVRATVALPTSRALPTG